VSLVNTGQDAARALGATESGTIYTSLLVNVSAAQTGDYFYAFYNSSGGYNGRILIRSNGAGGFNFGVAKNTTTVSLISYEPTARSFGTTYLLVLKLTRNNGSTTDDVASLWVDPILGAAESLPTLTNSAGNDNTTGFTSVALRQGGSTAAPSLLVGNILVGTTWAAVTPTAGFPSIATSGTFAPFFTFAGTVSAPQSISVTGSSLTAAITATAPSGFEVSSDGVAFGTTASLSDLGGTLHARVADSAASGEVNTSITLSSTGATDVAVAVTAAVRPNPVALPYGPEAFTTSSFPWYTFTVAGVRNWTRVTSGGNSFMEINGFDNAAGAVPADAWLILGPFDFPEVSNLVASFSLQRAFNDAGSDAEFTFKYTTEYTGVGDPSTATWNDIPFTKPEAVAGSSTIFTPSGAVSLPANLGGQTGVYLAFQLAATSPTATSRWRVDDFEVFTSSLPVLSVIVNPSIINEGATGIGTVSIPEALGEDVVLTVTSADPMRLLVDNGYGDPPAGSCEVPLFAGETSALFNVTTTRDFEAGSDTPIQVTAESDGYTFGQTIVTVRNIDRPSVDLTAGGYTQNFSTFSVDTPELPLGWSAEGAVRTFPATGNVWGEGTSAGYRGGASVFGYQHTSGTGVVRQILTLRNATDNTIDALTISYLGMVQRTAATRFPEYAVTVNGDPVPALAYTTIGGVNIQTTASLTGLSVAPGQTLEIVWTSERGAGSDTSRQIGIGNVSVQLGATLLPPTVTGLSIPTATITRTSAEVVAQVTSDGGSPVTARGFVYALSTTNPEPVIGGAGVVQVADASTGTGAIEASLSALTPGTSYSVRAYATNAEGTVYTPVQTFTTVSPAIAFGGSYAQPFNAFTGAIPTGWTAISSGNLQTYAGAWGTGSSAGLRGGVSNPGVLGYQHTASSGTFTVTANFTNDTGAPITTLFFRYLGRVARADQQNQPAWAVSLNGSVIPELAYSTGNTSGPDDAAADQLITAEIAGLDIPAGADFSLSWVSDRGEQGGTSRQIGIANFQISTSEILPADVAVTANVGAFSTVVGTPSEAQTLTVSGSNLLGAITVAAPAGFEVSDNGTTYAAQLDLTPVSGAVGVTTVRVRLTGAQVGSPAGNITVASTGTTTQNVAVSGTVISGGGGQTFDDWAGGAPLNQANLLKYAIGGASSPAATDGVAPVTGITTTDLTLTAIVRTNDPSLATVGAALTDLLGGPWSTNGVTMTPVVNQDDVPEGCERQIFSTPRGVDGKKFLRLQSTLGGQ
jgi:sulfur carrier protein ThiS